MLKGIDPLLSPDLLHAMRAMGHGDEIAIVDANFPATTNAKRLIRLDGVAAPAVVRAILSLFPLDDFEPDAAFRMAATGDEGRVARESRVETGDKGRVARESRVETGDEGRVARESHVESGDAKAIPPVVGEFQTLLHGAGYMKPIAPLERFAFYERARNAFAVVATGETRWWGNLILKKGALRPS